MREQVRRFHTEHPEIWDLFVKFTLELIGRGFKNYSAQHGVFAQIRWHTDKPDVDGQSTFKINNNYSAFYARAFMKAYPEHAGFFRTREQVSREEPAVNRPELTPSDFPYSQS